jgi:excisionase family DNA binding protein
VARDEITAKEAAHLLGCTVRTVNRMAEAGQLEPSRRLDGLRGARWFYRRDVQKLAAARAKAAS